MSYSFTDESEFAGLGYKFDPDFNQVSHEEVILDDPEIRPLIMQDPALLEFNHLIRISHSTVAYITQSNKIAIVDLNSFCYSGEVGKVVSLCPVIGAIDIKLAALTIEGYLYFLDEKGNILDFGESQPSHYKMTHDAVLLSAYRNELIFFKSTKDEYFVEKLISSSILRLEKIPKHAFIKWAIFINEECLRVCYFEDGEEEWIDFNIVYENDKIAKINVKDCCISGKYLGFCGDSLLVSSGYDALCINPLLPDIRDSIKNACILMFISYVASSKSDLKFLSLVGCWVVLITDENAFFYEKLSDGGTVGKQWIQGLPKGPLGAIPIDSASIFILYPDSFVILTLK